MNTQQDFIGGWDSPLPPEFSKLKFISKNFPGEHAPRPPSEQTLHAIHSLLLSYPLREQLLRCREHLSSLLDECATLEREEREREGPGGVAARGMLRARLAKVSISREMPHSRWWSLD